MTVNWRSVCALAMGLAAGPALAVEAVPAPSDALPPPVEDRVGLVESNLVPADRTTETPPHWTGELIENEISSGTGWLVERPPEATWVTERLEWREQFVQPMLLPPVQSTFLARLEQAGGWNPQNETGELDQFLHVSAGWLEIYAPVFNLRDDSPFEVERFRVNLRLPKRLGDHHVVALHLGTNLPTDGRLVDDGGYTTMAGYAFGSEFFSAQVRAGFGYDQLIGDYEAPLRSSIFYDGVFAVMPIDHLQVMVQADGQRYIGEGGNVLRLWPGVRFFPFDRPTFSLGLGAQIWFEEAADDWFTRRAGGFLDFGWVFL